MKSVDEVVEIGLNYPLDEVIKRYADEQEISIVAATEHALESKRYLVLCAIYPDKPYAMRGPIDEFWHTFVTFTPLYMDFCKKVAGRYLHHIPNTSPRARSSYRFNLESQAQSSLGSGGPSMREHYVQMLVDYEATFKVVPPAHLWPRPGLGDGIQPESCSCACGVCGGQCGCIA